MAFTLYLTPFVNISSPPEMVFLLKYLFFVMNLLIFFPFTKDAQQLREKSSERTFLQMSRELAPILALPLRKKCHQSGPYLIP